MSRNTGSIFQFVMFEKSREKEKVFVFILSITQITQPLKRGRKPRDMGRRLAAPFGWRGGIDDVVAGCIRKGSQNIMRSPVDQWLFLHPFENLQKHPFFMLVNKSVQCAIAAAGKTKLI